MEPEIDKTECSSCTINKGIIPMSERRVEILVTEADKQGLNIAEMSDFMDLYVSQQVSAISNSSYTEFVSNLPISDLGIINDVIQQAAVLSRGEISLIPDFAHLPKAVRDNLKSGHFKIGESKQVDGNLRPVILDQNGIRVKDITLKKVVNYPGTLETTRSISNQLQMKQINDKLASIQEIQSYQLDRDRDHTIFTPFLNARDYILQAQNAKSLNERNSWLEKAIDQLTTAKNGINTEIKTASNHLADYSKWPVLHRKSTINTLTSHIIEDIQLATKVCGIKMQVYEYLGQPSNSRLELEQYQAVMHSLITLDVHNSGYTTIDLIHDNFKYTKNNRDFWYSFAEELDAKLLKNVEVLEAKDTYILSLEG